MIEKIETIGNEAKIKCPWCDGEYEAQTWNDITYKECKSREMKRAFKPIFNKQVWSRKAQHFYKCPKCGMWSKGDQLSLIGDDGEIVKGLGGQPVLRVINE